MFTTSLIVLTSERPLTASVNACIYVGVTFIVTDIFKTVRLIQSGYMLTGGLPGQVLSTLLYGAAPAVVCGILGAILWNGRKRTWYGRALRFLPLLLIIAEGIRMYLCVFREGRMLFQALLDTVCAALYILVIGRSLCD